MPVANGNGIIGGGSLQTDGPGLQAFSVQPYSAKRGSTSCLSTVSIISPGRAARTMHLSKKTAIGIVITRCSYALAHSSLGQALLAPSPAQAAQRPDATRQTAAHEETETTGQHLYGHPKARFTLVEFSDFECPFCKSFHVTLKQLVEASQGHINWQWKHLPLHPPVSQQEAESAECVAQQKGNSGFWRFAEALFTHTRGNGAGVPNLDALLRKAGIDLPLYRVCLRSGQAVVRIEMMKQEALALGIDGTPATLIIDHATGNRRLIRGLQSAQNLIAALKHMLEEVRQTSSEASVRSSDHPKTAGQPPHHRASAATR